MTTQKDVLLQATGERSVRAVAIRLDMFPATLNKQLAADRLPLEVIVNVARAYGLDLGDLMAALGYITRDEARALHHNGRGLEEYSDAELAEEVYQRTMRRLQESA